MKGEKAYEKSGAIEKDMKVQEKHEKAGKKGCEGMKRDAKGCEKVQRV